MARQRVHVRISRYHVQASAEPFDDVSPHLTSPDMESLTALPYREREIIMLYFGMGDGCRYTPAELGRIFHTTPQFVRWLIAKISKGIRTDTLAQTVNDIIKASRSIPVGGIEPVATHKPQIDPRALTMPHAVENPTVSIRNDAKWVASDEAAFREASFHVLYDTAYASEKNPALRFAKALAASCRPFRRPALIPTPAKRRGQSKNVLVEKSAPSASVVARAVAPAEGPTPTPDTRLTMKPSGRNESAVGISSRKF